jgi:site-specific DNA-methyltransferase (adenine-specific)
MKNKKLKPNEPKFSYKYNSNKNKITIYQNDVISFLENLPDESVDLIVTDPAYSGMNNKLKLGSGRIVGKYADKGKDNGKWFGEFTDTEENYGKFLTECKRVLKKSTGHIYLMFDSYSLLSLGNIVRKHFDVKNIITWDKVNIGMGHYYRRRHEYVIFATNGNTRKIRNRKFPDVWRFKRIHMSKYPTQKPVEVFQAMIHASSEKDFTVCDPFLGSASSAIASIKNNCNFIGCDIADKSMEITDLRITEYLESGIDNLQLKSMAVDDKIFWK